MYIWKNHIKYILIFAVMFGFLLPAVSAIAAIPNVPATGAYIEAEDYVAMGAASPWAWTVQSSVSGYQGTGYLYTTNGGTGTTPNGSRIDFPVNFTASGTYQIWLRARDGSPTSGGDSTFWGIDGAVRGILTENSVGAWEWTSALQSGSNQVTISTAGNHTINLWPRERDQHTDAIFIIRVGETMPANIYEDSTLGAPGGSWAKLDFTSTGPDAGYITIDDGQFVNGGTIDFAKNTATDANDLVYKTDLTGLSYRPLAQQTDGFNTFSVDSKWSKTDVGGYTTAAAGINNNAVELIGSGVDIWGTRDSFSYLYQSGFSGNFTVDVRVNSLALSSGGGTVNAWAKAGIMVRQSLATTSRHATVVVTPGNGVSLQRRNTDGGSSLSTTVAGHLAPKWLRIQRNGSTFNTYRSDDATTWTLIGSDTVIMSDPVLVGLAVTSHSTTQQVKATFDHFMVTDTLMNTNGGWVGVATPFNATSAGWASGVRAMGLKSGTTFAANTFDYSSCVDSSASSITIPASQIVSGSAVSLTSLYSTAGNIGAFSYQINGVGVNNPWNSASKGTVDPGEDVTFTVTGIDPDCGGKTISASQTIRVDNTCQDDTPSTINIPTGQTTGGHNVDISKMFTHSGDVTDYTYTINGGAEIPIATLWDTTTVVGVGTSGTVTLVVKGIDYNNSCPTKPDIHITASNQIHVDNSCGAVDPTILFDFSPKYVAPGKQVAYTVTVYNNDSLICDPMDISLALIGDTNGTDFDATILSAPASQSIPGRGSATWTMTVGAKSGVAEWQENTTTVRATVDTDPNAGHSHSTVDASTKTVVFLVSPITHNSVTTKSSKWGGDWGTSTPTSKYGNFTCLTCHEKDAANVKWLSETVATPDGSNWGVSGYNSLTVKFYDARDGSLDWGNDDPDADDGATDSKGGLADTNGGVGRNASTRSCEVCHSITQYHRYDTETDPPGVVGPQTAAQRLHFNDRDCMDCHRHSEGFTADCTNCHGNPPIDDSHGGPAGLADVPGKTGSSTAGTHYKHVVVLKFPCTYCHANYRNPDQMPRLADDKGTPTIADDLYDINHTFDVFGSAEPAAVAGHYTGQDGVYYEGVKRLPGEGTLTCDSIYCHGGTDNMGGSNPQWNGNITCDACHGTSATNTPPGYSHSTHVGKMGIGCSVCHGDGYGNTTQDNPGLAGHDGDNVKGHVNGSVHIDLTHLTEAPYNNVNPTYRGSTTWNSGALAPSATYGTCSNVACHHNNVTPVWNNGPANCTTCHNNNGDTGEQAVTNWGVSTDITNAAPATGNHDEHCDPTPATIHETMIHAFVNKCESCHGAGANTGEHIGHFNHAVTFAGGFTYNAADASCTNSCHATDASPNDWNSTVALPCQYCHMASVDGISYIGPTVVNPLNGGFDGRDPSGNGTYWTGYGSHMKAATADNFAGYSVAQWDAQCQKCHPYHQGGSVTITAPASYTEPVSGSTYDLAERLGLQFPVTGGVHLGGSVATGSSEAQICWNCHTASQSEWNGMAYNGYTVSSEDWTAASFNAPGAAIPTRATASIHTANPASGSASVAVNVNSTTGAIQGTKTLEAVSAIRCTYCHDVHDMNRALVDPTAGTQEKSSGSPFLRGTWLANPYPLERPPETGDTYAANRWTHTYHQEVDLPRLFASSTGSKKVGGFFIDQNSNWPTSAYINNGDRSAEVKATAGICVLCHGTNVDGTINVDGMDYYTGTGVTQKLWRPGMANGHSNSSLGGSGGAKRNIFDARHGGTVRFMYMGAQDGLAYTNNYGDSGAPAKSAFPAYTAVRNGGKPGNGRAAPPQNLGWWGTGQEGTQSQSTGAELTNFNNWFSATGIGTHGGSSGRAHDFSCSKCHTPHASGLPALLITNCLDVGIGTWSSVKNTTLGPTATNTYAKRAQVNCHRKEGTRDSGWNNLAPNQ